jgi:hypothetical protein
MGYGRKTTAEDHLLNVHGVVAAGLCASAAGVKLHLAGEMLGGDHMTLAQVVLGGLIGLGHVSGKTEGISWWRFLAFLAFGLCAGANVGTWIESALQDTGFCAGSGWEVRRSIAPPSTYWSRRHVHRSWHATHGAPDSRHHRLLPR